MNLLSLSAPACYILVSFFSMRLKLDFLLPNQVLVGYCIVKWELLQLSHSLSTYAMCILFDLLIV